MDNRRWAALWLALIGAWLGASSALGMVDLTVAGPFVFQRAAGVPRTEIRAFSVDNPRAAYVLELKNGAADGSSPPVTSAVAYLNGERILQPDAFKRREALLEVPVTLARDNSLSLEVRSEPGAVLKVRVKRVANHAPLANAGADQTAPVNATVQLDGTGSSDGDGDALSHQWTVAARPAGSIAGLSDPLSYFWSLPVRPAGSQAALSAGGSR